MFYDFICSNCGHKDIHIQSIKDEMPDSKECPMCGGDLKYDWGQVTQSSIHIPDHMKATSSPELDFNKMPRDRKTYY